ncbi:amino acid ABC transporter permease [Lacrimispora xylanolytica]|jgi:polar amino acid transport system permease protein|uniref:Amino acid ABC transporter permease n=1 Tax=Lacrimispora xylanolytica TaxID=29375 RepID=A0ABY7A9H1_9FIRM|nr:amino acid ABC transporter permease [Lacrimispora xylanolytica]MBS5956393.1 amino acid ABC transporter permease [Clostridiales bacterium]WAJ23132.1 amino acid ABC transporter permease [Lacrimispora xylanolytica]
MSIWDFSVIPNYFMSFLDAAKMTVLVTVFGILIGIIFGLILALMRISNYRILSIPARVYIWIVRGTPLLLQLLLIYFGLVNIVRIGNLPSAFLALGLHNAAYIAEIFRGSIQGIARGQREAGLSLGMTEGKVMRRIVLPQAFKRAVPSLSNQLIIALKDSSLASAVAIPELLLYARQLGSSTFRLMEMLSIAAIYYLIMTSVLTILANGIEKRLNVSDFKVLE